jgi:hypothetical protein
MPEANNSVDLDSFALDRAVRLGGIKSGLGEYFKKILKNGLGGK